MTEIPNMPASLQQYLSGSEGKKLMAKHKLNQHGVWGILTDTGVQLAVVEGVLEDVIEYALSFTNFYDGTFKFMGDSLPRIDKAAVRARRSLLSEEADLCARLNQVRVKLKEGRM